MKITFEIEPNESRENKAIIEHLARAFADRVHRERVIDKLFEKGLNEKRDSEREGTD